ncbi:IS5 family transposase [Vogesella amnigena]|uniref:IS5 family transposase n=1 Tax=Vogesella amnigena TaxID=1507449 RepID=A0ABV7TU30_9NEIS
MQQQTSFAELEYRNKKRQTRRELFLAEMETVVPWANLLSCIEPHYPKAGRRGRQPMPLASMFRIYCLQQWFNFSDRQMEDALYEIDSVRRFAGFACVTDALPDETTILNFRHLLEKHDLPAQLLARINAHLQAKGITVSRGSMVDASIIHAPSSTKNAAKARDPEMHQTMKNRQWYFGMKLHVGVDVNSGAVHSVVATAANRSDIEQLPKLLRASDEVVFGDTGYASQDYKRGARALGLRWCVQEKGSRSHPLSSSQRKKNRKQSSIRARVEHVFRVIKRQFAYTKVRYRGLAKNAAQVNMLESVHAARAAAGRLRGKVRLPSAVGE